MKPENKTMLSLWLMLILALYLTVQNQGSREKIRRLESRVFNLELKPVELDGWIVKDE
jgi:hypothetical protein